MAEDKILHQIAGAFKDLASGLHLVADSQNAEVKVAPFSQACSLVSPLFGCLGVAFKFAERDYVGKVIFGFIIIKVTSLRMLVLIH